MHGVLAMGERRMECLVNNRPAKVTVFRTFIDVVPIKEVQRSGHAHWGSLPLGTTVKRCVAAEVLIGIVRAGYDRVAFKIAGVMKQVLCWAVIYAFISRTPGFETDISYKNSLPCNSFQL